MKSFNLTMSALVLGLTLVAAGCDDDGGDDDAGPGDDSGMEEMDAGPPDDDAGPPDDDAGPPDDDGGTDSGMTDGGAATSAEIQAVLDAADGATTLMINDAIVTYTKTDVVGPGVDGAGFFLQAEQMGPALYVAVDPASLTPAPAAGDVVDLQVDMKNASNGIPYAEAVSMWNVDSSGNSTAFLVQDVTMVDLVTNLDDYTSELVAVTGATLEEEFGFGGTGFDAADITTTGVPTASGDLRFRLPETVRAGSDLGFGCTIDVGPTPLWRFNATVQISAWDQADFTVSSCPSPGPNDLTITEIGFLFTGADDDKEFVEIHNSSESFAFELMGCRLADDAGFGDAGAVEVTSSLIIGPGERVVFAGPVATSEVMGDVEIPTGTLGFDDDDMAMLGCGCSGTTCTDTVDVVDWDTPDFLEEIEEVSVQLSPGSMDNDDLTNWCSTPAANTYGAMGRRGTPGMANVACPCPLPAGLVISEIDYDQPGGDDAEFIEIFNPTAAAIDLTGLQIVGINGNSDPAADYGNADLSGMLAAGAYVVIGTSSSGALGVPTTFTFSSSLQNGAPDGVMLVDTTGVTDVLVDAVVYEGTLMQGDTPGGDTLSLGPQGADAGADSGSMVASLARRSSVNICDRDIPGADFAVSPTPTPGAANMF